MIWQSWDIHGIIQHRNSGEGQVADIKSTAWKDTVGLYLGMVVVAVCLDLLTKTKVGALHTLGVPFITAIFFYVFKRKDWFD
jgi:hypothetical protein